MGQWQCKYAAQQMCAQGAAYGSSPPVVNGTKVRRNVTVQPCIGKSTGSQSLPCTVLAWLARHYASLQQLLMSSRSFFNFQRFANNHVPMRRSIANTSADMVSGLSDQNAGVFSRASDPLSADAAVMLRLRALVTYGKERQYLPAAQTPQIPPGA